MHGLFGWLSHEPASEVNGFSILGGHSAVGDRLGKQHLAHARMGLFGLLVVSYARHLVRSIPGMVQLASVHHVCSRQDVLKLARRAARATAISDAFVAASYKALN